MNECIAVCVHKYMCACLPMHVHVSHNKLDTHL